MAPGAAGMDSDKVISDTKNWLEQVVIGCNFCPFAGREFRRGSIRYTVLATSDRKAILTTLALEFERLDEDAAIETTLIILPGQFPDFNKYLDLIDLCQDFLEEEDREGVYQIASFHPTYLFAGAKESDAENYTNRSPYPMIHILREASLTAVLENFPDPEAIPEKNIAFARQKGLDYMRKLREQCMI